MIAIARLDFRQLMRNSSDGITESSSGPALLDALLAALALALALVRAILLSLTHIPARRTGPASRVARHERRTKETCATAARMCRMHAHARAYARRIGGIGHAGHVERASVGERARESRHERSHRRD